MTTPSPFDFLPAQSGSIPTGLPGLDRLLDGGLRPGTVNQLVGRTSAGKTSLVLQAVRATAFGAGANALHVTAEEDYDGITRRLIAAECGVRKDHLYRPERFTEQDRAVLEAERVRRLTDAPYFVNATADTLEDVEHSVRSVTEDGPLHLVTIDHLGLLLGRGEDSAREYAELGMRLHALARETNAAILIVTYAASSDPDHAYRAPTLSDRRTAEAHLDQACDTVLILHLPDDRADVDWKDDTHTQIHVAKRRNGMAGSAEAIFERAYGRFRDLNEAEEADPWRF